MTDVVRQLCSLKFDITLLHRDGLLLEKLKEDEHQCQQAEQRDDQIGDGDAATKTTEHP